MAFDKTKPAGSDLVSTIDTTIQANNAVVCKRSLFWYVAYPSAGTKVGIQYTMATAGTFVKAWAMVTTHPLSAALIVDINTRATEAATAVSIWTNQANRLTVADGAESGNQTSFDVLSFNIGDIISLDLDAVGTTPAVGLTIQLDYELA